MKIINNIKNYLFIFFISVILFLILFFSSEIITRKYLTQYLPVETGSWKKILPSEKDMRDEFIANGDNWIDDYLDELNNLTDVAIVYSPFKIFEFSGNLKSKYINVINGERIPYIINNSNCLNFREINIFGGSAVHGDGWLRDQDLLNHQIGKLLEQNGYDCFKFNNRGVSGYNSKQNFVKFFEIEKSKNSINIFYDGSNDFMHNIYSEQGHLNQTLYEWLFGISTHKDQLFKVISLTLDRFKFIQLITKTNKKKLTQKWNMNNVNSLCKKWSSRASAIYNESKINNSDVYFIWQITINDLSSLNKIENEIKSLTVNHLGDIFGSYDIFRDECVKEFSNRDLKLHTIKKIPKQDKVLFFDYIHLNPPGNKIIAKNIFDIIKNEL